NQIPKLCHAVLADSGTPVLIRRYREVGEPGIVPAQSADLITPCTMHNVTPRPVAHVALGRGLLDGAQELPRAAQVVLVHRIVGGMYIGDIKVSLGLDTLDFRAMR